MRALSRSIPTNASQVRSVMMAATQTQSKREGNIADSFVSLSGDARPPLPQRFLDLKKTLIHGHEDRVISSWKRLLAELKRENEIIAREGPQIIPSLDFQNLDADLTKLRDELKKRGVAVIRGVLPEDEARSFKGDIEEYVRQNPHTKGNSQRMLKYKPSLTPRYSVST